MSIKLSKAFVPLSSNIYLAANGRDIFPSVFLAHTATPMLPAMPEKRSQPVKSHSERKRQLPDALR